VSIALTGDQTDFQRTVRAFVERKYTSELRRSVVDGGREYDGDFWKSVTGLGVHALGVPEEHGGSGGSVIELGLALEEMGAALTSSHYFATSGLAAQALHVLGSAGQAQEYVARIADGATATVALPTVTWRSDLGGSPLTATEVRGQWTVSGTQSPVIDGHTADLFVVPAILAGAWCAFVVERDPETVDSVELVSLDPTRKVAEVAFRAAAATKLGFDGASAARRLRDVAALAFAADQLGAARRCLEMAVAFAAQRVQHGQTIGSFQSTKHLCADVYLGIESARACVYHALATASEHSSPGTECEVARLAAAKALTFAAEASVQIHGAIGFDWEHDAHLYLKRAKSSELFFGPQARQRELVASSIAGRTDRRRTAGTILPADLVESTASYRAEVRDFLRTHLPHDWVSYAALPAAQRKPWLEDWRDVVTREGKICVMWPREYGGQGRSLADHVVLTEEFNKAGVPMQRQVDILGMSLLAPTLMALGNEDQKRMFLPKTVSGEIRWCQGYSEPGAGSDLAAVETSAELRDGQWVINGQKIWTTSGHEANWIFLLARTDRTAERHAGLSFLLVPLDQPGIDVRTLTDATGRPHLNQIFFTDATTPADHVVGDVNGGWRVATALLGFERGDSAIRDSLNLRNEFWRLVDLAGLRGALDDGALRGQLADRYVEVEAITNMALRSLATAMRGAVPGPEASLHKLNWSEYHQRATSLALELLGPDAVAPEGEPSATLSSTNQSNAPSSDLAWVQNYIAGRAGTIYAGTSQIQRNIIAERVLGMPRSPRPA